MKSKLFPYQTHGVKYALTTLKKYRGVYIADEMGLGKTIQGLAVAHETASRKRPAEGKVNILIISPAFLCGKWKKEIVKHLPKLRNYNILVTSFSALSDPKTLSYYTRHKYAVTIIDEGHYIKNYDSLRTQAILKTPGARHRTIEKVSEKMVWLSGTPIPNRVGEIYPFLKSIKHPILKNQTYEEFVTRWAQEYKFTKMGLNHKGIRNPEKLKAALSDCMIRRETVDVLKELPPLIRDFIPVPISKTMEKMEKKFEMLANNQEVSIWDEPDMVEHYLKTVPGFEQYAEFRKKQSLLKVDFVLDYFAKEVLPGKKKFVVYTYHKETAQKYFDGLKVKNKILITGDVPAAKRLAILEKANKMEEVVLIATLHSIKEGFDLVGFDRAYWTEIDWGFYLLDQTEKRFHRIGQENTVFCYYFLFDGGMEDRIFNVYTSKKKTVGKILPVTR